MARQRLHKVLAHHGVASLRASERLIREGKVTVNGTIVDQPGASVEPNDRIEVNGHPLTDPPPHTYILLNKPKGIVSTVVDTHARSTVLQLVQTEARVYPVGRLDKESEGLLLLTDDGDLANRLMHPRYGVHKVYRAEVAGDVTEKQLQRLRSGVLLEDGPSKPVSVWFVSKAHECTILEIVMGQGRKRQVRRMLAALGLSLTVLTRTGFGPLGMNGLRSGESRHLTTSEISALREAVGLQQPIREHAG